MSKGQSMTPAQAIKSLNHIQLVLYVVGFANFIPAIKSIVALRADGYVISVPGVILVFLPALVFLFLAWSLKKSYRNIIPKIAVVVSIILFIIAINGFFLPNDIFLAGILFPFILLVLAKQSNQAIKILDHK